MSGNEWFLSLIVRLHSTWNISTMQYFTYSWHNTFTLHAPNLMTMSSYFLLSHYSQETHKIYSTWINARMDTSDHLLSYPFKVKWKGCGRKQTCPALEYYSGICRRGRGENTTVNQHGHCLGWHSIPAPAVIIWKYHLSSKFLGWSVLQTVLWLSPLSRERMVHMGFVVDKVALWQVSHWILRFSLPAVIPEMLHTHLKTWGSTVGLSHTLNYCYTRGLSHAIRYCSKSQL
jgi:hypothetical protein